ncbi:MAG: N-6 DNA methylase [Spirochaetaceae bacterium]|jgi:predicted helicase|nr:N-6 DNA methylase [Spirochaetaceae bacterium]
MAAFDFDQTVKNAVQTYLDWLSVNAGGEEIQYRAPLENVINAIMPPSRNFSILQEDRHSDVEIAGIPDFFVYEDDHTLLKRLVGFIECKKPAYPLEKLIESEQIKKYSRSCENIILTNYHRFILLQQGRILKDITLGNDTKTTLDFQNLFFEFYQYEYPYINTKKMLAKTLAAQSFYYSVALREFIADPKNSGDSFFIKFNGLFGEYQKSMNYYYVLSDFCDIYSQSLVYGLMLARIDTGKTLDEHDLEYLRSIPDDYKLLIEFLSQAYESRNLPPPIKLALINIGKNINLINIEAINQEFAKMDSGKQSIAVYLYEDFLSQYDKHRGTENRKEGGVYYTPYEVAGFIVRSVNDILMNKFNLDTGFSSKKVKTLDFASGTGTFLHSIMEIVLPQDMDDLARRQAKEKILNDIYGFEVNFTPHIISHTLLTRFLAGKNITFENNERLGVYLTNTLDISHHSISALLPRLKYEHDKSMAIKSTETILAIVGNPPYFGGRSKANSDMIDSKVADYKKNLAGETNLQPLDDLYIKFIRFAQWKIEKSGEGVIGIVTNNSFLDGLIHRQMRRHLYETFDEIYILNLHGNTQKKEGDKNIFDILIGVGIVFFIKYKTPLENKKVFYYSTIENNLISRKQKLNFLENTAFNRVPWIELNPPETTNYWFVKKDLSETNTYNRFMKITDIFNKYSSGIEGRRDAFCIKYSLSELDKLKEELSNNNIQLIRDKYQLIDGENWDLATAMKDLTTSYNPIILHYRPFDFRYTSLSKLSHHFLGRPFYEVMRHFENKENIGISFVRQFSDSKPYTNVMISQYPIERRANYSFQGGAYFAPLYVYNEDIDGERLGTITKTPNFTQSFCNNYLKSLKWKPTPEDVLSYIYAVLHAKIYREKYIVFLKTGFPAIPMTRDQDIFTKYAVLGKKLIELHLLKSIPLDTSIKVSLGDVTGSFYIDELTYANSKIHLSVSPAHTSSRGGLITFEGVTPDIFDFEMGARKPMALWIKNRKKDRVSLNIEDLQHIKNMIIAIKQTISVMKEIELLGEDYLHD